MYRLPSIVALVVGLGLALPAPRAARAQDPVEVAPDVYKVVFENPRVRVMEVVVPVGAKTALHSHPDHFAYAMTGGKIRFTHPDGKSVEAEIKTGEVIWVAAEKHMGENIGDTDLRVLVVELKEPARKPAKDAKPATKKN